jgi:4,5-dihydroxyphthalate decarboxylase
MAKLRLTLAVGDYEIHRALKEGTVVPDGIDLVLLTKMGSQEFVSRMIRAREFDGAETGVNFLVSSKLKGHPPGLTGVPIFSHRRFRHGFVFINPKSDIKKPKDLIGKRVGSMFIPTANIWARGILDEYYGVPYKQVKWVGEHMGLHQLTPKWHEMAAPGVRLQDELAEGRISALICPDLPPLVVKKDPRIGHLFGNYRDEEVRYFKDTGLFPIMHLLVLNQEIVDEYPWVPTELIKAFEASKRIAYKRMINPRIIPLAFHRSAWEEQEELMGTDPWENGLTENNRKNLETFMRYMVLHEMIDSVPKIDDLFAPFDIADMTPDDWH